MACKTSWHDRVSFVFFVSNNAELIDCHWLQCLFFIWKSEERQGRSGGQGHAALYLR